MQDLKIDVKITERKNVAYADDETKYEITISGHNKDLKDEAVLKFCTDVLTNCNKTYEDDTRNIYEPYYTFERKNRKDDVSKYVFTIIVPFLD